MFHTVFYPDGGNLGYEFSYGCIVAKEIVERRHGEPIKYPILKIPISA